MLLRKKLRFGFELTAFASETTIADSQQLPSILQGGKLKDKFHFFVVYPNHRFISARFEILFLASVPIYGGECVSSSRVHERKPRNVMTFIVEF